MKNLIIILCVLILCFSFTLNSFALSATTYSDLSSSSSTGQNLLNLALNHQSFRNKDFVIFQNGQYSYYIVWSDKLDYSGISVSADEIEYIQYIREGSGYDYTYRYIYGTDTEFSLTINNLTVSNVDGLGFISPIYEENEARINDKYFNIFIVATLFVVALTSLRGFKE